ncbi:hypothetical protein ACTAQJ_15355 [Arthrobacter sp. alpha11c]
MEVPIAEMVLLPASSTPADIQRAVPDHARVRVRVREKANPASG